MRIFVHFLYFFITRIFLLNEAFVLRKDRNPCASSPFFEAIVNPSWMAEIDKRARIDNPFISINPSGEEVSKETEFNPSDSYTNKKIIIHKLKSNLDYDSVETRDVSKSEGVRFKKNILEEIVQLRVNTQENVRKPAANRKPQSLIQSFDDHSKSLICPSAIQEEVEINPDNSQPRTSANPALELDIKTNPSQFQEVSEPQKLLELEASENSIYIDFTKLKSRPQIILRSHSFEQNTIKPEVNYIYLLLPKNESVDLWAYKNRTGVGDEFPRTKTDQEQADVNPVEVNSEKSFIHDLETKLEILLTPSVMTESANNTSIIPSSDDTDKKGSGYELKVDESEMDFDYKEIDLSFLKNVPYRRRH